MYTVRMDEKEKLTMLQKIKGGLIMAYRITTFINSNYQI